MFLLIPIVLVILANILGSNKGGEGQSDPLLAEQQAFLSIVERARTQTSAAANSLAVSEELKKRDIKLAKVKVVAGWRGEVLGVQQMQGKAAVSVDIGGVIVVAGVHLSYDLDTLIPPGNTQMYSELLNLQSGDRIVFSGRFIVKNESVVELGYTSSVSSPELLFEFSNISKEPK